MKSRLPLLALFVFACLFANLLLAREAAIPKTVDKFTDYMADRFADAMPEKKVTIKGPLELHVVDYDLRLDSLWRSCAADRSDCANQVNLYLARLPAIMTELRDVEVKPADIRVVVRGTAYVEDVARSTAGMPEAAPVVRSVAGDIAMICVVDQPRGFKMLSHADLVKLNLSEDQAIALGLKNVAASLPPLVSVTEDAKQVGFKMASGDFYESSRMLLHDSWAETSKAMGGHLVVAVPQSDMLVYSDGGGNGVTAVGAFARYVVAKAQKPISSSVFHWTPTGWEVAKPE